jgi:hypothetical protein
MTITELQDYCDQLLSRLPLERYIERRFTAASEAARIPLDTELRFSRILRDREPKLQDVLKRSRVMVLSEPGGGKSVVARAAVHQLARAQEQVPVFIELKEYRGNLAELITRAVPPQMLAHDVSINGSFFSRAYVFDGIDEIPGICFPQFGKDLQELFDKEPAAHVLLTARHAFYAAHRDSLPSITSFFHILDFSDKDIAAYVEKSGENTEEFLKAIQAADASEEIRNPFILSVMIEKYRLEKSLSDRRTENLNYMTSRLIASRPRVNQHQQRKALKMLGVTLETYSRNELTEDEALRVIKQAMRISDLEARSLLDELQSSILKRTANGLAFQMRSYGEFLAAEALEDESMERVKQLAFLDYKTPNETWLNAVSYLIELNPNVRRYFVRNHPLWAISASQSVFSEEEKDFIVGSALRQCENEKQYVTHHPLINVHRLSHLVTRSAEKMLIAKIEDNNEIICGNALILLGMKENNSILQIALRIVKDRSLGLQIRHCAIIALVNIGTASQVPELLAALDPDDPIYANFLDSIGALIDDSQIATVLPLILHENTMLSSTYYHFRELKTRNALIQVLRYFIGHPHELNIIRAESYLTPILEILPQFFDAEVAELCVDLLETVETQRIYPNHSGLWPKLFQFLQEGDRGGDAPRIFFERIQQGRIGPKLHVYDLHEVLVSLMKPQTAQWLIDKGATGLIQELAPYCRGEIREMLRAHSGGVIDGEDVAVKAYREEQFQKEESRSRHIAALQSGLLSRTSLDDALNDFCELTEDYWPELPEAYRGWLASEVSKRMSSLDLRNTIRWEGTVLRLPRVLPPLLQIIDRYALKIVPDEPLIFVLTGWDTEIVAKYHKRFPLGQNALRTIETLLEAPPSPQALEGIVRFLESSDIWSANIESCLKSIASNSAYQDNLLGIAFHVLVKHDIDSDFIEAIARTGITLDLKNRAFETLVQRQHRPTIERALAHLTDDDLRAGDVRLPRTSPLDWIVAIKSGFAWGKLEKLRARALQLELPMTVGLLTNALAGIDHSKAASLIRRQASLAPESWRSAQIAHAIEQERAAIIEAAQRTPFEDVLKKLKGSTSINRLKVLCEGPTDRPIIKSLIDQIGSVPEIILGSVGGWANLRAEPDPNVWLHGCKEAVMIMDGDLGRHLEKPGKPYTAMAKEEMKKLSAYPIDLRVLERYGIENYFPQHILEKITGADLSSCFPIPDHVSAIKPFSKGFLYSKSQNEEVAKYLKLQDLEGTDLLKAIQDISDRAMRILDE